MALKIELKPKERILVGRAMITNGDQRAHFTIDGDAPILREKDILSQEQANSPAKLIYFAIQLMYTTGETTDLGSTYFNLVREFLEAAPSAASMLEEINNLLISGHHYKALKQAKRLVAYEQELINNALTG